MTLRLGRWQDVLGDVGECDAVITDVPYSRRTVDGYRTSKGAHTGHDIMETRESLVGYDPWCKYDAIVFADHWTQTASWIVMFCDHVAWFWMDEVLPDSWISFQPVPWCRSDAAPRFASDGPCSGVDWIMVARKRGKWALGTGSRPGYYTAQTGSRSGFRSGQPVVGAKDLRAMTRLVKDYSRPGDLIVDPYAGSGTTLLAAAMEGRRAIGAEMDPKTYELAVRRLSKGYTERLFREGLEGEQQADPVIAAFEAEQKAKRK